MTCTFLLPHPTHLINIYRVFTAYELCTPIHILIIFLVIVITKQRQTRSQQSTTSKNE